MILAKSDPSLERTGRPPRADGRFFHSAVRSVAGEQALAGA
jgi:hypothetical protein